MKSKIYRYTLLTVLGILLLAAGFLLTGDSVKTVSGLCIGLGAALVGVNAANFIMYRYNKQHPDLQKRSEIEAKDERSVAIVNKAKAKAFDITVRVLIVIPFLLILANSPLWMTLCGVALYLFGFGAQMYYTMKFSKEM